MNRHTGFEFGPPPQAFNARQSFVGANPVTTGDIRARQFNPITQREEEPFSKSQRLSEFFGEPRGGFQPHDLYDDYDQSHYDLPQAYANKSNDTLTAIIINRIRSTDLWPLVDIAPWMKWENSLTFQWDEWHFNDHLLGRTPEEAVSRTLSMKRTENRASMVRYGIAFILEHGFYLTEKGRKNFTMNLVQISNAILETAAMEVMHTCMNYAPYQDPNNKHRRGQGRRNKVEIDAQFRKELDTWAIIQKTENGFDRLVGDVCEEMEARVKMLPNTIVFPSGTRVHVKGRPEEKYFLLSGRRSGEERDVVAQATSGMKYRESRGFKQGDHQPDDDPCWREQTIGNHVVLNDLAIKDVPPEKFRTPMLDRILYNEDQDDFDRFSYEENAKYQGLFNDFDTEDYPSLSFLGQAFFSTAESWGSWFKSTGKLDYIVAGLASKSIEVQQDFIKKIVAPVVGRSGIGRGRGEDQIDRLVESLDRFGLANRDSASLVKSHERLYQQVMVGAPATIQSVQRSASERGMKLHPDALDVLSRRGHLETLNNRICNAPGTLPELIDEFALVSPEILQEDINESLMNIPSNVAKTALERSKFGNPDATIISPQLVLDKNADVHPIRIFVSPFSQDGLVLPFNSQILTLTTSHLVLLQLEDNEVEMVLKNKGKIDMSNWNVSVPQSEAIHGDVIRSMYLQVSVQLSLVLYYVSKYQSVSIEDMTKMVISVLSRKHPRRNGIDAKYSNAARYALSDFKPLASQRMYTGVIRAISELLFEYYDPAKSDKEALSCINKDSLNRVIVSFLQLIPAACDYETQAYSTGEFAEATAVTTYNRKARESSSRSSVPDERAIRKAAESLLEKEKARLRPITEEKSAALPVPLSKDIFYVYGSSTALVGLAQLAILHRKERLFPAIVDAIDRIFRSDICQKAPNPAQRGSFVINAFVNALDAETINSDSDVKTLEDVISKDEGGGFVAREEALRTQLKDAYDRYESSRNASVFSAIANDKFEASLDKLTRSLKTIMRGAAQPPVVLPSTFVLGDLKAKYDLTDAEVISIQNQANYLAEVGDQIPGEEVRFRDVMGRILRKDEASVALVSAALQEIVRRTVPEGGGADVDLMEEKVNTEVKSLSRDEFKGILNLLPIEDGGIWKWFMSNDVLFPLGGIIFRPHGTWEMGSGFAIVSGYFANSLYGHADMMLGDDAGPKMHTGHFTFYNKMVVWSNRYLIRFNNVLSRAYLGGNGCAVWDPTSESDRSYYYAADLIKDIFYVPIPINWSTKSDHLDLTGQYYQTISPNSTQSEATHYPFADIISKVWRWQNTKPPSAFEDFVEDHPPKTNTLCFQAHNFSYNYGTNDFTRVQLEKGHWGKRVYPGCGEIRRGQGDNWFKPVAYDQTSTFAITA